VKPDGGPGWGGRFGSGFARLIAYLPGLALCCVIAAVAMALQHFEELTLGHPYVDALQFGRSWDRGIAFSARTLLEIAVMLLGASVSFGAIVGSGAALLMGIVVTVAGALVASYAIGMALDLPPRVSILIACGNSICGNSAIAAVAPVIGAKADEVASSIAFTGARGARIAAADPAVAAQ